MGSSSYQARAHLRGLMRVGIGKRPNGGGEMAKWRDRAQGWLRAPGAAPWDLFVAPDFPEDPIVDWRGPDGQWGRGALRDLPEAARRSPLRVWTPAVETLLTVAQWPGRGRGKLAQALPYLLEEQLLADPEALAFSYRDTPAGIFVAVTAKDRLAAWRAALDAERLTATLCPVTLALPWRPGTWSCRFADGQWAVRTGTFSGFGAAGQLTRIPAVFRQALEEARKGAAGAVEGLTLFGGDEALRRLLEAELGVPVVPDQRPLAAGETPAFRLGETGGTVGATGRAALRALRPAFAAIALLIVLGFAHTLFQWVRLGHAEARMQARMTALFTESFPNAPVLDPAAQMRRGVAKLAAATGGAGEGFLAITTVASPALAALAQGALTRLSYRHGVLRCAVRVADFGALTTLKRNLMRAGLAVRVSHVMSHQGGVQALVSVTRRSS